MVLVVIAHHNCFPVHVSKQANKASGDGCTTCFPASFLRTAVAFALLAAITAHLPGIAISSHDPKNEWVEEDKGYRKQWYAWWEDSLEDILLAGFLSLDSAVCSFPSSYYCLPTRHCHHLSWFKGKEQDNDAVVDCTFKKLRSPVQTTEGP